jgi:hypothetical protein
MPIVQVDRSLEYSNLLNREIRSEGLALCHQLDDWNGGSDIIKTRRFFGKAIAYIDSKPDLSPREYHAKPDKLEMTLIDPTYESAITRILESVEKTFGIETVLTKQSGKNC